MAADSARSESPQALDALASRYVDVGALPWVDTPDPGIKMKVLMHDAATDRLTVLVKLAPGARIPEHTHEDLEQMLVLEGSLVDHEGACTAGNFVLRPAGSRHSPYAPDGCLMLVFFLKGTIRLQHSMYDKR
jgi:anti-sigma factor ChrR (cupin superfamily)